MYNSKITEARLVCKNAIELIPHDNPPKIHRTADDIEWKLIETVSDYEKMKKARLQNKCRTVTWATENARRIRFVCYYRRRSVSKKADFYNIKKILRMETENKSPLSEKECATSHKKWSKPKIT
jgi:hypothetical protein